MKKIIYWMPVVGIFFIFMDKMTYLDDIRDWGFNLFLINLVYQIVTFAAFGIYVIINTLL